MSIESSGTAGKQLVTFKIDNELFGMDIRMVNEVNPNVNIIPVPLSDRHIRGHVNIRGQVVLIMDIMVIFGKHLSKIQDTSHLIIFKTTQELQRSRWSDKGVDIQIFGDKPVGILVDNIGDVINVGPSLIEKPIQHIDDIYSRFVEGIVKLKNELLIIIDPVKILYYKTGDLPPSGINGKQSN